MEKMKFFYLMLVMIMSVGMFASCGDDEPTKLSVSLSSIEKDSEGGSLEIDVQCNTKWFVSGATDWCTVTPKEGEGDGFFEVTISENSLSKERKCTLKVRTNDGTRNEEIAVTQNAKEFLNATGPITFAKEKGNKKVLQISSNVAWEITGIPEWLDCNQKNGSDSRDVEFTTKTENTKGTRSATLTVNATGNSSLSSTVEVTQEGKSEVKVTPKGLVTLSNSFAFMPKVEGNVKRFKAGWLKADRYNSLSENEILEVARQGDAFVDFNEILTVNTGLSSDTEYYLVTLAYDNNDEEGEVYKTKFRTKPSNDAQAYVTIGGLYRSGDQIIWEATPDGSTDSYYTAFLCGLTEAEADALCYIAQDSDGEYYQYWNSAKFAWLLNNEIELNSGNYKVKRGAAEIWEEKGYYVNNNRIVARGNSFQLGYAVFITWGVNISDKQMSGLMKITNAYVSLDDSGKKMIEFSKKKIMCPENK